MATDDNPGVLIWRTRVGTVSAGPEMKTKIQIHPRVWTVKHVDETEEEIQRGGR